MKKKRICKKKKLPLRNRDPDRDACAGCYQQERCLEYGRGRCSQYKNLEAIRDEIRKITAEMRMKGGNVG